MPEVAWKAFIDFEISQKQFGKARKLYEALVEKTHHFKVYIAFAMFEANVVGDYDRARKVFDTAHTELTATGEEQKEELMTLLNTWHTFEKEHGSTSSVNAVEELINPSKRQGAARLLAKAKSFVAQKRKLQTEATEA
eukprot:NODE_2034_length_1297_cov_49.014530_g1402_i1.p2 GENE.NODE_2034_length_1297_cov_49.014530_g1402_i1~~NODE_2034_length_1297_cov_49.014530_g1402_i1.p2  ORF type:complete len:138 (-),score=55.46 NODE_2034_length_1297_cov_49.014530_g1402_i1:119-532(-)